MATAAKAEDIPAGAGDAPKKKKKGLIIGLIALVVLAGGGGAAWFFLKPKPAEEQAAPKPAPKKASEFMSIEPWFTVNLTSGGDDRYLQAGIVLELSDKKAEAELKAKMPVIRSGILLLLSGKAAKELLTAEGKSQLAKEILDMTRSKLEVAPPENGIEAVHFSVFVIQ